MLKINKIQYIFLGLTVMASSQVFAFQSTTNLFNNLATSGTSAGASASSYTTKRDKVIVQAQNDAAAFVASNGQIRGVYLESAFTHIRSHYPINQQTTDIELAKLILSH